MPTDRDFLAAIAANPEHRQTRLIYADWLEDQGDARAELIRVMEEMRTLAPYSDRFWELRARRAQLKQGVPDDWFTMLGYNVYRPLFGHIPAERLHRWRLMAEFIETWHGPLEDSPGNTEEEILAAEKRLGLRLPVAMREWYGLFGRSIKYWNRKPRLWLQEGYCQLDGLKIQSGHLCFRRDQKSAWGIQIQESIAEDPDVEMIEGERMDFPPSDRDDISAFSHWTMLGLFIAGNFRLDKVALNLSRANDPQIDTRLPMGRELGVKWFRVWERQDMFCFDFENPFNANQRYLAFTARNLAAIERLPAEVRIRLVEHKSPNT